MDARSWMYGKRDSFEYLQGVDEFVEFVKELMRVSGARSIPCSCVDCKNIGMKCKVDEIRDHLVTRSFLVGYTWWVRHREEIDVQNNVAGATRSGNDET